MLAAGWQEKKIMFLYPFIWNFISFCIAFTSKIPYNVADLSLECLWMESSFLVQRLPLYKMLLSGFQIYDNEKLEGIFRISGGL